MEVDKVRIATISDALCYGTKFFDAQAYFDLPLRLRDEERLKQAHMELDELEDYHIRKCCGSGSGIRCLLDPWI